MNWSPISPLVVQLTESLLSRTNSLGQKGLIVPYLALKLVLLILNPSSYAYVEFSEAGAISNALLLNDSLIRGRLLRVNPPSFIGEAEKTS